MKIDRKALLTAYRERKVAAGIFAVTGPEAGQCWVGLAPDLSTVWNRTTFQLRLGGHPSRMLQAAWSARGGEGFAFREVERLDTEETGSDLNRTLRARLAVWAERLAAEKV